jgi:hypothetical protein
MRNMRRKGGTDLAYFRNALRECLRLAPIDYITPQARTRELNRRHAAPARSETVLTRLFTEEDECDPWI